MDISSMAFEVVVIVSIVAIIGILISKVLDNKPAATETKQDPAPKDPSPDPRLDQEMDVPDYTASKPKSTKKKATKKTAKKTTTDLPSKSKLTAMKKADLEKFGKQFGIDLDRRKTKDNMVKDLQKHVKNK